MPVAPESDPTPSAGGRDVNRSPNNTAEIDDSEVLFRRAAKSALMSLLGMLVLGAIALGVTAISFEDTKTRLSVVSAGLFLAGASAMIGALLGFLFGIPRTLQGDSEEEPQADRREVKNERRIGYRANTNLEQISDWLTKILVGVGLTQLTKLPDALSRLSETIAPGLGAAPSSKLVSGTVTIYFATDGFLMAYLWTRLYLPSALRYADLGALGMMQKALQRTTRKLSELEDRIQRDGRALYYADSLLSSEETDEPPFSQDDLNSAIKDASGQTRARIFYQANEVRKNNWQKDPRRIEKTIPIFRALIASDPSKQYHRNYGQLGYALKDKPEPDFQGAVQALTAAIEIRGSGDKHGYRLYEGVRAYCKIQIERQAGHDVTPPHLRAEICEDLQIASRSKHTGWVFKNQDVIDWVQRNDCKVDQASSPP